MSPRTKKRETSQPASHDKDEEVAAALRNPELMRQLEDSLKQEKQGEKPTPFRDILAGLREGSTT